MLSAARIGATRCFGQLDALTPRRVLAATLLFLLADARPALAEVEVGARVPIALGVSNRTESELGITADLVWFPAQRSFGVGLVGQLTLLGFSNGRRQLGLALGYLPDNGNHERIGPGFDLGVASDPRADSIYGHGSFQIRSAQSNAGFTYAWSSALYLELRRSISGPAEVEASLGVQIGGGLLAHWIKMLTFVPSS